MGYMLLSVFNSTTMSNAGKWLDVKNPMCWFQSDDDTAKIEYSMLMLTNGKELLFVTLFCRSFEEALVQILRKAIRTKQKKISHDPRTHPSSIREYEIK